jgi:acyl carrier protein
MTMYERIRAVLARQANLADDPGPIAADANLYDLGMTSHASVNVMLELENEFDVEFPDRMLNRAVFSSLAGIRGALCELGVADAVAS